MTESLSRMLSTQIGIKNWNFYLTDEDGKDKALEPAEVVGESEFLPAILWQASKYHQIAHERPLDIQFSPDQDAFLGVRAELVSNDLAPRAPLPLFCIEVLVKCLEDHPTLDGASLDKLVDDFAADAKKGLIPGVPAGDPQLSWAREAA